MNSILSIKNLSKIYGDGFQALKNVNLEISRGEIFALLGPNGAGKTTLIGSVCGLVKVTSGQILVDGFDHERDFRKTREIIGLVPQELTTDAFETVIATVSFSRGLFGKKPNPAYIEEILKNLSLWERRDKQLRTLSGGMKRRVMIAKALSHEPKVLFLDEPTAGVDVELRKDMWNQVHRLRQTGVTIILTTHYIEEAEEMADRIGVINQGELVLVENKLQLMKKLGFKELALDLIQPIAALPAELQNLSVRLEPSGDRLVYQFETSQERNGVAEVIEAFTASGLKFKDLHTKQSSLEEIFVKLVKKP